MPRGRTCHQCHRTLDPILAAPAKPDFWMRLAGPEWVADTGGPQPDDATTSVSFRCRSCDKTFRLVLSRPQDDES